VTASNPYRLAPEVAPPSRSGRPRAKGIFIEDQPGRWAFWIDGRIFDYGVATADIPDAIRRARLTRDECAVRDGGRDLPLP
jgi:hypothetical protein